jgi:sporulation protein YlmC with PRC-barrel domain
MRLIAEVLDKQVLDRRGQKMGKVDGIVIELRADGPPRVAAVEIGSTVLARRLHPALADWLLRLRRRAGVEGEEPLRIPFGKVRDVGIDLEVDLDAESSAAFAWERWLRERIVGRIPGSGA